MQRLFFKGIEVSLIAPGKDLSTSTGIQLIKHQIKVTQEISILSQLEHENIVRYLGTDKDDSNLYVFLELLPKGSLASLYRMYRLYDTQVSTYTKQILSGLHYLHSLNVVHRDIRCDNILVGVNDSVKLADFGFAKVITQLNDIKSTKGSPRWMAPEVVRKNNNGYGRAADIWSLGCTVLEMLTGQFPYYELEGVQALFQIGRGKLPTIPEDLSEDAKDFIHKCLQVNPSDRPTAAELSDHPFLKTASPLSDVY
ncbi:mitogen-activated protein kinase kinase kinase 1-like [Ipomoea triloba]|uniref:mitogen-activated protein kinase kinase kinase 1-like n=1 Tax=Ipomoea triloba TaxID=35885 RepID=UPI00125E442B|nr:mitogen-activated protein kinase kinase kinase 1-like [Ipomoea triloba]